MILILIKSLDNQSTYYIERFKTREEALEFVMKSNCYIGNYKFIEGQELKLTFKISNNNEGDDYANTN